LADETGFTSRKLQNRERIVGQEVRDDGRILSAKMIGISQDIG
jgi:hypothetical protein